MITLRHFRLADLAGLDPPALTAAQLDGLQGLPLPPGQAFTAEDAGQVLGCAGVLAPPSRRVGRAWAILGDELRHRPLVLHRQVLCLLPRIATELGLDSIEARVRADYTAGQVWLERLGFRRHDPTPAGEAALILYARRFTAPLSSRTGTGERHR